MFHAGTAMENADVITSGGRVLCVVALDDDLQQAQTKAYQAVEKITWDSEYYRTDIGFKAIKS